jgi:hypothetical protein
MGHQRLGEIPKTQRWGAVVARVATGGGGAGTGGPAEGDVALVNDIESVASEILDAAQQGLDAAINDPALRFTFNTLTQIVLAARQADWQVGLSSLGIQLSGDSSLFDLTSLRVCRWPISMSAWPRQVINGTIKLGTGQ